MAEEADALPHRAEEAPWGAVEVVETALPVGASHGPEAEEPLCIPVTCVQGTPEELKEAETRMGCLNQNDTTAK